MVKQDMPPKGGFPTARTARISPPKGFKGATLYAGLAALTAVGFSFICRDNQADSLHAAEMAVERKKMLFVAQKRADYRKTLMAVYTTATAFDIARKTHVDPSFTPLFCSNPLSKGLLAMNSFHGQAAVELPVDRTNEIAEEYEERLHKAVIKADAERDERLVAHSAFVKSAKQGAAEYLKQL